MQMVINFVTEPEDQTWILRRWCEEWSKRVPGSTISEMIPSETADVNIYVYYALLKKKTSGVDIAYFTHRERDRELASLFDTAAKKADWCFAQCRLTASKIRYRKKVSILRPGVGDIFQKKMVTIGVVGREYRTGRKRFDWLEKLKDTHKELLFLHARGQYTYGQMPQFYKKIDYLLVTAENEGGPMPVTEALAMGVPVIVPRKVGWCDEFPGIRYTSFEELQGILRGITISKINNDWDIGAAHILKISERLFLKRHIRR